MTKAQEPVPNYIDYLESLSKKQLMVMLARARQEGTQGISIIGMGCRFPGEIDSPDSFWAALRDKRAVLTAGVGPPVDSLGQPRWNLEAPDIAPMAELLRSGAYLSNVDLFDAEYFGLSDEEVLHMDPQQRLLLEVTVQALADANLSRAELRKRRVGIFVGTGFMEYSAATLRNGITAANISPHMLQGNTASAASGRLGLMLGVNGPAVTLDTASSSALAATHLAVNALRQRECDIAIVGSCHLLLAPFTTAMLAKSGVLSPTGRSRPFTTEADGHVRGEGCGVFVLKRYSDAVADADLSYAMIRGSALHQHGDRFALSVSTALGQITVIEQALRSAGVDPLDVHFVEAQANGSHLGGVVEAESVAQAYRRLSPTAPPLYLGSCKANIGYMEVASGAPGLMKTALALANGEIPPQLGAENLDPSIAWDRMALRFAGEALPWPAAGRRLAGVSAFGMNGINGHAVLENIPGQLRIEPLATWSPALLVLSAHNEAALTATAGRLHRHLASSQDWNHLAVCLTLAKGRDQLKVRSAGVVQDRTELLSCLAQIADRALPPAQPRDRIGLFLDLPDLSESELRAALTVCLDSRFGALDVRIRSRADAMGLASLDGFLSATQAAPQGIALAWSLGCLDLLAALGIELAGCATGGPHRHTLLDLVTGSITGDEICSRWLAGDYVAKPRSSYPGWEVMVAADTWTLRRPATPSVMPAKLATLDMHGWLTVVADRFCAGEELGLSALSTSPRPQMVRLPGPVLTGKHYWPEEYRWS